MASLISTLEHIGPLPPTLPWHLFSECAFAHSLNIYSSWIPSKVCETIRTHACSSKAQNLPLENLLHTLQRRLLIGSAITVAAAAFALVPTDALRIGRPSKPLFFYLIPLVRVQASHAEIGWLCLGFTCQGLRVRVQGKDQGRSF